MPLCNTVAVTLSILCISPCSTNQFQMGKIVVKPFLRMTADALKGLGLNIDEREGDGDDDDDDDGGLGPEDGEFEGEEEDYCGYAPL